MKVYDTNMELIWEREEVKKVVLGIEIEYKDFEELAEKLTALQSLGKVIGDFDVDKSCDKLIRLSEIIFGD
jgi:CRISPR/Cas system-associated endonuclease Cas3-HD